jgi:hypothetical protein
MPQLDTLTYFTQFFWFIISFIGLYILIDNIVLPQISKVLKTRNYMKSKSVQINKKSIIEILSSGNIGVIDQYIANLQNFGKIWAHQNIDSVKTTQLVNLNTTYFKEVSSYLIMKKVQNENKT